MLALPGLLLLVITIYVRPHEFVPELKGAPVLYYAIALAMLGMLLDARAMLTRLRLGPHLPYAIAFWLWCVLTTTIKVPGEAVTRSLTITVAVTLCLLIAHGIQTFKSYNLLAAVLLAIGLFVTVVCVHQGMSDLGCVRHLAGSSATYGRPDGRPCETSQQCYELDSEPGFNYACERMGMLGTTSIMGRVRYLGVLQDPNEVALTSSIIVPLAFAFRERRPSFGRTLLLLATLVASALCCIYTQSRGGQLVFCSVLAVYFVRKYGLRGLVFGALLALPLILLGGRSGEEASRSTEERFECWYTGVTMLLQNPVFGVGHNRFGDHHYLTAHSSFVLAAAELGLVGSTIFTFLLYLSFKIPITAMRRYAGVPEAAEARTWAVALLAVLTGMVVGIALLSFTYHYVLWIHLGLVGAFYGAIKTHDPEFDISLGPRDVGLVAVIQAALIVGLVGYTRLKA